MGFRQPWVFDAIVEILNGPYAGVFTRSDEEGSYRFSSLPPGPVRVRATVYSGEATQTLDVNVSGSTVLDFRF
jgi:hypothetical protein